MNKLQIIQEAYGEYWDKLKDYTDENGWCTLWNIFSRESTSPRNKIPFDMGGNKGFRPKSLRGIEDNNGWIKINSEKDYPSEEGNYKIGKLDKNIFYEWDVVLVGRERVINLYSKSLITHYQKEHIYEPPKY